jgi:nucleotide-binding universal stress UspA family protein
MNSNIILVTTDFTPQADNAMEHALILKDKINGKIVLMHVVSSDEEVDAAYQKIEEVIDRIEKSHGVRPKEIIRRGNIFNDIPLVASEIGAKIVIMGTHGVSGLQHIFGSKALKVISMSKVPFITVTEKPKKQGFDKIVMPFNLSSQTDNLLRLAVDIAKAFDSEIHMLGYSQKKDGHSTKVQEIKNYLEGNKISFIFEKISSSSNFEKIVLRYSNKVDAGLISISNNQDNVVNLFGGFEQNIIANKEGFPVMVVNNNSFGIK